jgi:hypothetical protein
MKLKFTQDYSGRETAMKEYKAGEQADIPNAQALELVKMGVAREVWASIGAMYDPKPLPPSVSGSPVVLMPESTSEAKEEAPAKPRKKGKVKRDKNAS